MFGLALIFALAIMGGIIAFIGDNLGYKLGKRRLSVFGLRPRHTSTLMTIVSGVVIAAITLGALSVASTNVRTALFGLDNLKADLARTGAEVELRNKEIAVAQTQLLSSSEEIKKINIERDRISAHLKEVELAKSQADRDLASAHEESDRLGQLRDRLQQEADALEVTIEQLREGLVNVREGQVAFQANQVVYAGILRGGQSESVTVKSLEDFLAFANNFVVNKLELPNKDAQIILISREDFLESVKDLMGKKDSVAVRLQAAGNILVGEPIITRFVLFPNELVYPKGKEIYVEKIPANIDKRAAEGILVAFLSRLNSKAVADGVLPDPVTGNVGNLDMPYMMEVMEKIRRTEGGFIIKAVAEQDIYTLGPLKITLNIQTLP